MAKLTDEKVNMSRHGYLLKIADELMTAPREQIEFMYNESMRRAKREPDHPTYGKIAKVIEQVIDKRFWEISYDDEWYNIKPLFPRKGGSFENL